MFWKHGTRPDHRKGDVVGHATHSNSTKKTQKWTFLPGVTTPAFWGELAFLNDRRKPKLHLLTSEVQKSALASKTLKTPGAVEEGGGWLR